MGISILFWVDHHMNPLIFFCSSSWDWSSNWIELPKGQFKNSSKVVDRSSRMISFLFLFLQLTNCCIFNFFFLFDFLLFNCCNYRLIVSWEWEIFKKELIFIYLNGQKINTINIQLYNIFTTWLFDLTYKPLISIKLDNLLIVLIVIIRFQSKQSMAQVDQLI